jgi:single-strand DNA-binding protein
MNDTNHVIITGTMQDDPKFSVTINGHAKASFTVKVQRPSPSNASDFIKVLAWEKLAENIRDSYHKEDRITVDGYIRNDNFLGSDGNKVYLTRVIANEAMPEE